MYAEIAADPNPREILTAIHISDVHIDKDYVEGSLANCDEVLCCRDYAGYPKWPKDIPAPHWGYPKCDIPVYTLQSMLDYIRDNLDIDMLFWTGDNSPHNIWYNTEPEVAGYVITVSQMLKDTLGDKNIAFFPIHGNHDTWVQEQ